MRPLRLPALPRFGAPAEPTSPPTPEARPARRPRAASRLDTPIRLRVSPTVTAMSEPTPPASGGKRLAFSSFARALRDASAGDTTVEVEEFCADPTHVAPRPPEQVTGVLPPPARVEPVVVAGVPAPQSPEATLRAQWASGDAAPPSGAATPTREEVADLAAIRRAAGAPPSAPAPAAASLRASASTRAPAPAPTAQPRDAGEQKRSDHPDHSVFDRMALATTFDVGTISLERRFRDFDAQLDRERRAPTAATRPPRAVSAHASPPSSVPVRPMLPPLDAHIVDDSVLDEDLSRLRAAVTPTPSRSAALGIALAPSQGGQSIGVTALVPGDIIVSTVIASPVSAAIRFATNAPVSHTLLYLGDSQVAEAIGSGVVIRSIFDAVADSELAVAFRVPELSAEQAAAVVSFARAQQGKPYNYLGIVRHAVFRLDQAIYCWGKTGEELDRCRQWLGRVLLGPGNADTYLCSQLVLDAYRHAGVPLTTTPPVWTSPADVVELALNRPWAYVGHIKAPIPG